MKSFDIDKLRVASPCPMSWNEMTGDDRTRHCSLCELNVHNIAGMTSDEVERLFVDCSGRLCIRLVRRAEGTVMTRDCLVGLRAYRKRIAGFATATFAAILSLFSISYGQKDSDPVKLDTSKLTITRSVDKQGSTTLTGTIVDESGAVIPGMFISLLRKDAKDRTEISDADGYFSFGRLSSGVYEIRVEAGGGFRSLIVPNVDLAENSTYEVTLPLAIDPSRIIIGVTASEVWTDVIEIPVLQTLTDIVPRKPKP